MRIHHMFISAIFLAACTDTTGEDSSPIDTDTSTVPPQDPCEVSGNVCTWLGSPGVALFSGEGTDRSDRFPTTDDPGGTFLFLPTDITFASDGTAYYPDFNNHRIRKVSTDDIVTTLSGTGFLGDGPNDYGSVTNCWAGCDALSSAWNHPTHIALDPADESQLYIAAWHNSRLNVVDTVTTTMTWLAGTGARFYGPGLDPTTAALPPEDQLFRLDLAIMDLPSSMAFGPDGTIYFSDQANHLIRKIAPGSTKLEIAIGQIESTLHPVTMLPTFIRKPGFEGDGGDALLAKLHGHTDQKADPGSKIVADNANNRLLIADTVNGVIRAYDYDTKVITTIAGKYESAGSLDVTDAITGITSNIDAGSVIGYSGDGGDALQAVFNTPRDIAVGIDGEIYIADTKNHCVRVLRDGVVDGFAGICDPTDAVLLPSTYSGDGGPALDAQFSDIFGVEVDPEGNVYVVDSGNQIIRRVKH